MILRLSLDLPDDVAYIRTARLLSRCLLEDIKVDTTTIDDVENIVSEMCSNVIRHAASVEGHFLVTLEYFQPKVIITVADTGPGFVLADVPPSGTARSDGKGGERFGGFGIPLLDVLSDKVDFSETDPHGTTVRVEKNLKYQTAGDAAQALDRDKSGGAAVEATT